MTDNNPGNMLLPMTQWDINMAMRLLNKEFVKENIEWVEALNMMVQRGENFEIEALSSKKIDYLPFKLKKLLAKLEDDDKNVNIF
jgi:DNA topoisomerase VI subunit A